MRGIRRGLYRVGLSSIVLSCRLKAPLHLESLICRQTVPHSASSDRKTPVTKSVVGPWYEACPVTGRTKILATTIDSQLDVTVSSQKRRCSTRQRLHKTRNLGSITCLTVSTMKYDSLTVLEH